MTDTVPTTSPPLPAQPSKSRRLLAGAGLLVLAASAVFGANPYGVRERVLGSVTADERPAAVSRNAGDAEPPPAITGTTAPPRTVLRSQPWWQGLTTIEGTGPMTAPAFTVDSGAIQWRVRWTCQTGRLSVQAQGSVRPVVSTQCPGEDTGYGSRSGPVTLQVAADGPWKLVVEQQIDLPLSEPPLPAMTAPGATRVASGSFYRIDQFGEGQVVIYRLPDGGHALRLENFYVTPNTDLTVELSPLPEPRTTDQTRSAPAVTVAALDVTAGAMNFRLPPDVNPSRYRSVVIWCERLFSAYSAATLRS